MSDYEIFKEAYLNGLEPKFKYIACQMFEEEKPVEEIYRHISNLRHRDRGTIEATRPLTFEEKTFLRVLPPDVRKKSYAALMSGKDFDEVKVVAERELDLQKLKSLQKETVRQAAETVLAMQKCNVPVPMSYYELIFDWDTIYSMDYEFCGKVGLIMLNTYDEHGCGDTYQKVRSFMFSKIEECFDKGIIPPAHIFDFMFSGGWISDKTFMILHLHAQELIDVGMGGKLALPLERMLENRRKDNNPQHPFSQREEHYFLSLINLFKKGM